MTLLTNLLSHVPTTCHSALVLREKSQKSTKSFVFIWRPCARHFFYILFILFESGSKWSLDSHHHRTNTEAKNHTLTYAFTPANNSQSPFNLTCMFLDGGRKPEYPDRTHTCTARTCKLHTERPQLGFTKNPLYRAATVPTTSQCRPSLK